MGIYSSLGAEPATTVKAFWPPKIRLHVHTFLFGIQQEASRLYMSGYLGLVATNLLDGGSYSDTARVYSIDYGPGRPIAPLTRIANYQHAFEDIMASVQYKPFYK